MSRLDRGRAHDILVAQEWLALPVSQREAALLNSLETCIEPDPTTRPTRVPKRRQLLLSLHPMFLLLVAWTLTSPVLDVLAEIGVHETINVLPFITEGIGIYALVRYFKHTKTIDP